MEQFHSFFYRKNTESYQDQSLYLWILKAVFCHNKKKKKNQKWSQSRKKVYLTFPQATFKLNNFIQSWSLSATRKFLISLISCLVSFAFKIPRFLCFSLPASLCYSDISSSGACLTSFLRKGQIFWSRKIFYFWSTVKLT